MGAPWSNASRACGGVAPALHAIVLRPGSRRLTLAMLSCSGDCNGWRQNEDDPLDAVSQAFQKAFAKADQFRAACGVCMLLEDNLLTPPQVRHRARPLSLSMSLGRCGRALALTPLSPCPRVCCVVCGAFCAAHRGVLRTLRCVPARACEPVRAGVRGEPTVPVLCGGEAVPGAPHQFSTVQPRGEMLPTAWKEPLSSGTDCAGAWGVVLFNRLAPEARSKPCCHCRLCPHPKSRT